MSQILSQLSELRTAVRSDLNVSVNSSLFPEATIDLAINRAYVNKISRLFRWPQLEDAKMTSTQPDQDYYDLPDTWSPDSAYKLEIDGDFYGEDPDFNPLTFQDFLDWKDDNPNSTEKKWAVHGHQFFVTPTPTAVGSNNISIWGQKNVDKLENATDQTVFSKNMPECNEAIVLEAVAILKKKGEAPDSGQMLSGEAKQILIVAFDKLRKEQAKYEKVQPFLEVDDMFGPSTGEQETGRL